MTFSLDDWHRRFRQQTGWTQAIRARWLLQIGGLSYSTILEVGCGTGALLEQLPALSSGRLIGVDAHHGRLAFAALVAPAARLIQCDALSLPLAAASVDLVLTQYFFLWAADPLIAAKEMRRVVRPGGYVIALAEPDYGARIDYPEPLAPAGRMQAEQLRRQGANPDMGRKLSSVLCAAGLAVLESCILGSQWLPEQNSASAADEWEVAEEDLRAIVPPAERYRLREIDSQSRAAGTRVLFVPTFCVLAQRPE
jgi:SAM-dependent methyltransferase